MPHTDGPLYEPLTTVISLGSTVFLEFYDNYKSYKENKCSGLFLIEPRSLYVFNNKAYTDMLHCVQDKYADTVFLNLQNEKNKAVLISSNIDNIKHTSIY